MQPLQLDQRRQRIGDPLEVALADRDHIQDITVFRDLIAQRLRSRERIREPALFEQFPYAQHFGFDAGCRGIERAS